jgi:hypothetical protein
MQEGLLRPGAATADTIPAGEHYGALHDVYGAHSVYRTACQVVRGGRPAYLRIPRAGTPTGRQDQGWEMTQQMQRVNASVRTKAV